MALSRTVAPLDLEGSIEHFAEVSALLHHPFAKEDQVLAQAGLDEAGWQRVVQGWMKRLKEDTSEARALATDFSDAYAVAIRRGPDASAGPVVKCASNETSLRFLNTEPTPWRADALHVATSIEEEPTDPDIPPIALTNAAKPLVPSCLLAPSAATTPEKPAEPRVGRSILAETADLGDLFPLLAMPFRPDNATAALCDVEPPELTRRTSRRPIDTGTEALPLVDRGPALPFPAAVSTPPAASGSQGGKRLVLFDPQTGERLAAPRWEDISSGSPTTRERE